MNEVGSQTLPISAPAWSRLRRWFIWISAVLVFVALGCIGVALFLDWQNDRELWQAVAEADRLDPGWRLQDLEDGRASVPDKNNGYGQHCPRRAHGLTGHHG
jgi:hypothetical protein